MIRSRPGSRLLTILVAGLLAIGGWQVWEGSWIYAKAGLAQFLLQRAWSLALAGEDDQIDLAGASGRTLAFGPGHVTSSALPGQEGTMVLTGHRDTHFRFLRDVHPNDQLDLTASDGTTLHYRIIEQRVMDSRRESISTGQGPQELVLVTCFPFDAIQAGGPLRYVVRAERALDHDHS